MFKNVKLTPDQQRTMKVQLRKAAEVLEGLLEEPKFLGLNNDEVDTLRKAQEILKSHI